MGDEIGDRGGEVMIGIHQPGTASDDAVAIAVRVVSKCDVKAILQSDQIRHGVRRRAVHSNPAVPIHRHETEGRIHGVVDDLHVHAVPFLDRLPIRHARPAERIDTDLQPGVSNGVDVHDGREIVDVSSEIVVAMGRRGGTCSLIRNPRDAREIVRQEPIRFLLDHSRGSGLRPPAVRRVVLESSVFRWIVRRGDHDTVRKTGCSPPIVGQDGVRNDGSRSEGIIAIDDGVHTVAREHLQHTLERLLRQRMCVPANIQRARHTPGATV